MKIILGLFNLANDPVLNLRLKLCEKMFLIRTYIENTNTKMLEKFE